ncbi:hypothetical protein T01_16186 [Trichinella spiralis]|uniref:Uncharacterized protein n=1 Tax=Trichinella spiralis TaxID=6334 RepID=A0A0V1AVH9_TRISP|nr:hypothetical protein T01_16186 [Trichinella spiralis]
MEIIPGISETTDYCKSNSKAILCQLKKYAIRSIPDNFIKVSSRVSAQTFQISRERRNREPPIPKCFSKIANFMSYRLGCTFTMITNNVMESSIRNYATVVE